MTDKFSEDADLPTDIDIYFNALRSLNKKLDNPIVKVFLASENHTILEKSRKRYPNITILVFPSHKTFKTQEERAGELDSIIRDIILLSQCEYVICAYSSNVS